MTRVAAGARGVVEAGWLAALATVPLFFVPLSDRPFDPSKAALVRILAGVMCAAWLVSHVAGGPRPGRRRRRLNSVVLPALALLGAYAVATAASLSPETSVVGAYDRAQGLWTIGSCVAIFLLVATQMRGPQLERAVTVALLATFPVAAYAALQEVGLDPLSWQHPRGGRATATLGNSAFLGGYLAMMAPLALVRLESARRRRGADGFRPLVVYALLLGLQLTALGLTRTWGPAVAAAAGLATVAMLSGLRAGARRRVLTAAFGVAALAAGLVAITNFPSTDAPNSPGAGGNPTAEVRVHIWEDATRLVLPHDPLVAPGEGEDRLSVVRPLVGYGPDSQYAAFARFLPPEMFRFGTRAAWPDRAHNETLDVLAQAGLPGALAYVALLVALLYVGLAALGLVNGRRQRRAFVVSCGAGATVLALAGGLLLERAYVVPAIVPGALVGATVFLIARGRARAPLGGPQPLLVALVGALVAHIVDTQVAIATTTTRVSFWVLAGATVAAARVVARPTSQPARERTSSPVLTYTLVSALVSITLIAGLVNSTSLAGVGTGSWRSTGIVAGLALATTLFALGMMGAAGRRSGYFFVTATLAAVLLFAAPHVQTVDRSDAPSLSGLLAGTSLYVGFLVVALGLVGAVLARGQSVRTIHRRRRAPTAVAIVASALLASGSVWANVRIVHADLVHAQAPGILGAAEVVRRFEDAVAMQPWHDQAHGFVADASLTAAGSASTAAGREAALARARDTLVRARDLNPFDPDRTLALARLHEEAAALDLPASRRRAHLARSVTHYREATALAPTAVYVRARHAQALVQRARLAPDRSGAAAARREALRQLDEAIRLDPYYCLTLALRSKSQTDWEPAVNDALAAIRRLRSCGDDPRELEGGTLAAQGLRHAQSLARRAREEDAFLARLDAEQRTHPSGALARMRAGLDAPR
jgi:O-antigen ligase